MAHPSTVQRRLVWDALRLVRGLYGELDVEMIRARYGVSRSTAYRWLKLLRAGDPL